MPYMYIANFNLYVFNVKMSSVSARSVLHCACVCMCVHVCACVCLCVLVCACVCLCLFYEYIWLRLRCLNDNYVHSLL